MSHPVFISYARKTSREAAEGLHRDLGGESGLHFLTLPTSRRANSFLRFWLTRCSMPKSSWYSPTRHTSTDGTACANCGLCWRRSMLCFARGAGSEQQSAAALSHLVVVLPPGGAANLLDGLPSLVRQGSWPSADRPATVAELVKTRLSSISASIREHIGSGLEAEAIRATLLGESALPLPMNLACVTPSRVVGASAKPGLRSSIYIAGGVHICVAD